MQSRSNLKHHLAEKGIDRVLLLLVPALLIIFIFFIYPSVYGIFLSFHPGNHSGFLGNYKSFFQDAYCTTSFGN
jgi:putative spermidine/putrescine transport system permease protein